MARFEELEIIGTEMAREWAMNVILERSGLLEKWNTIRGEINVVEKDENARSIREY